MVVRLVRFQFCVANGKTANTLPLPGAPRRAETKDWNVVFWTDASSHVWQSLRFLSSWRSHILLPYIKWNAHCRCHGTEKQVCDCRGAINSSPESRGSKRNIAKSSAINLPLRCHNTLLNVRRTMEHLIAHTALPASKPMGNAIP